MSTAKAAVGYFQEDIQAFLESLRIEKQYSPHTIESYQRDLVSFARYCENEEILELSRVSSHSVRAFAAGLHRQSLAVQVSRESFLQSVPFTSILFNMV